MANEPTARQKLQAMLDAHSTPQLLSYMAHLETADSTTETRLLGAMIADTITTREGIDAALDEVFMNDKFTGSYLDAIRIALAASGTGEVVQARATGAKGVLLNDRSRPIAIVHWDGQPYPTWADWSDIA